MRNSNIILGVATFALGVVGAINSIGANRFVANARVWTVGKVVCTLFTTACGNRTGICTTTTTLHRTVFTINSTNCVKIHPRIN
jgi:hypothetical protein